MTLKEGLFLLRVRFDSRLVGQTLAEAKIGQAYKVSVLTIEHMRETAGKEYTAAVSAALHKLQADDKISVPGPDSVIQANDVLLVLGRADLVSRLAAEFNLGLESLEENDGGLQQVLFTQEVGSGRNHHRPALAIYRANDLRIAHGRPV